MQNVLLITVDSLRADHLGCYGYERETSPAIDSLAGSAHRFTNAFAHARATRASFPSILTSTYAHMYGGFERLADERTVVSEPLERAGYRTGGFHSNPFLSRGFGYERGFDTFYDSQSDPTAVSRLREWVKQNLDNDGRLFGLLSTAFNATERRAGLEIGSSYVSADDLTDRAIEWIDETPPSADRNFLWIHYMDVHHPYVPPERYQRRFRSSPIDDRQSIRLRRKMLQEPAEITSEELRSIVDLYDAEIGFVDDEVGRLIRHATDAWNETAVFLTADHGEEFREHGAFSHGTFHEEGIHVPLVIDAGGTGGTHGELVGLLDLAPTILDYADVGIPETYLGDSLRPLLAGDGAWRRDRLVGETGYDDEGEPRLYYRDDRWKFIVDEEGEALYDLDADPGEETNVLGDHPDVAARIRGILADHRARVEETDRELGGVEVTDDIENRLRALGYREE
jgi:arylsulfatase A-like enzyme